MGETTDKINKLATQHKIIGAKIDCPYFSTIGNLCSRVQNGMMRCDEYLECEFKYIDALKEENEQLQKRFNDYQDRKIEENANLMKKLDIADKKLTVFSRELERANKENENLKEENARLRNFLNQYQEEANALKSYETYKVWLNNEYRKENEKLKQYLLNIVMIIEELEQQYDDIKDFTEIKEIKEILREVQ